MGFYATSDDIRLEPDCKTSACALGWATTIWPRKFQISEDGDLSFRSHFQDGSDWWRGTHYSELPVLEHFGISEQEAIRLFGGPQVSPKQKAKEIEKLVGSHGYTYAEE